MEWMDKTRKSVLNSITSILYTVIGALCNLIVIRALIEQYGSDFNGLNSTASQYISILMIIEGGFAIAANVALFAPLSNNDHQIINGILSAVNKRFHRIGIIFLCVGVLTAIGLTFMIRSSLDYSIRFATFLMLVVSTSFSLSYATKYKVLFQSDQREYLLNTVSIVTYLGSNALLYIAILLLWPMLVLRLIVMIFAIASSYYIAFLCKKKYPYVNVSAKPDFASIKGTNDVFVQKVTGVIYYAAPILAISSLISTQAASVYAVYNTVFTLIRSVESSVINAPRMSLGMLATEHGLQSDRLKKVFDEYELCMFISIAIMLSVAAVMIMPFVKLYAKGFSDISYIDWRMAVLLILICFIECIHIPSGNLINMSGHFRAGRNIQLIAGGVLMISLLIGVSQRALQYFGGGVNNSVCSGFS